MLSENALLNVRSDKRTYPPHGLFDGSNGAPSMNYIDSGNERRELPVLLSEPVPMRRDDVFRHTMSSGGGYGAAFERDCDAVLQDVILGKVSIEGARRDYGVSIVDQAGHLVVDQVGTAALRG